MADLRFPVMADISYDRGRQQADRGPDYGPRIAMARTLRFELPKAALQNAVEFEVVPGLLFAHPPLHAQPQPKPVASVPDADIKILAALVLGRNSDGVSLHVQGHIERGTTIADVFLKLLAPTAAHIKHLWNDDECDFAQATLGIWRLQQALRGLSAAFRQTATKPNGRRVLLTLAPGETHEMPFLLFNLVMTGEFFRRDGWSSWIEPDCARGDTLALVHNEWFDVIEILINGDKRLDRLAAQIKTIRGESINRSVCIAIAGDAVQQHPELVKHLDADVMAAGPENAGATYTDSNR